MKKYTLVLLTLVFVSGAFCQENIDIEKEKEAIKAVIKAETQAYYDKDFDSYVATHKHDKSHIDIRASRTQYSYDVGWEKTHSDMKEIFKNNPEPIKNNEVKKNFQIQVYQDCAWAVFDEDMYNDEGEIVQTGVGSNFLEKINGEWKIVYLSRVGTSSYSAGFKEMQLSEEILTKYTGKYELNPDFYLTIFLEDGHLFLQATGQQKMEMFAYEESKFFFKTVYAQIEFNSENDKVIGFTLFQDGEYKAKKIE